MASLPPNPLSIVRPLIGSAFARRVRRRHLKLAAKPAMGVRRFFELVDHPEYTDTPPVFILSAGWRSGSTLLQRLVSSGEGWFIWGEPYDRSMIVQNMVQSLAPFGGKYPPEEFIEPVKQDSVSQMWAATLYPPPDALRDAYRAMLMTLFSDPARHRGGTHWGFKETRFGLAEALLLKGLFPDAKFLFIRRDINSAFQSYKRFARHMHWYDRWPDRPVFTPYGFGHTWGRLTSDFEIAVPETGGILVAYEDLASGQADLEALERYLGTGLDRTVLGNVLGSGNERNWKRRITPLDRMLLERGRRAGTRAAIRARPAE